MGIRMPKAEALVLKRVRQAYERRTTMVKEFNKPKSKKQKAKSKKVMKGRNGSERGQEATCDLNVFSFFLGGSQISPMMSMMLMLGTDSCSSQDSIHFVLMRPGSNTYLYRNLSITVSFKEFEIQIPCWVRQMVQEIPMLLAWFFTGRIQM